VSRALKVAVIALAFVSGCSHAPRFVPNSVLIPEVTLLDPSEVAGLNAALPLTLDSIITTAIADGASPGAALAVGRNGRLAYRRGYGRLDWDASSAAVTDSTLYDLASLTKVIATTTAAMILEENGALDLDRTVASYLPQFNAPDKSTITIRELLTHRGGMEAFSDLWRTNRGREQYLAQLNARPLAYPPGTKSIYSDWDMILLQLVIERLTGSTLDAFVERHVFAPLHMTDTRFLPAAELRPRIAPTEVDTLRGGLLRGIVHDENAWALGGVSGNAGLFSTARDLSVFAQMMLNGGEYNGTRILKSTTIARWTARQGKESSRALGWDTPSPGSSAGRYFSPRSFGHTGFTGTSIWIDPEKQLYVILLTNRVDPTRANQKHIPLRRAVADAVQQAVFGAPLVDWESKQ
jgi:CubicO group peptidase (beta-lactamase class C family)